MTLRFPPVALGLAGLAIAPFLQAQTANLPPATQAAVNARRDELARQAKAETDAAVARRNAGQMPERLRTTVGIVQEQRTSTGVGQLMIQLTIFQDDVPAGATIRGHKILAAFDNLDRPITPSTNPAGGRGGTVIVAGARAGRAAAPPPPSASLSLILQAPARKAESIKLIDGEIEFLVTNDSTSARIPGLANYSGKVLENAALASNGIEITYLTKDIFDALKPTWSTSAAATGPANFSSSVLLLVKDPRGRVASIELQDAAGGLLQRAAQRNTNAVGVAMFDLQVGPATGISLAQVAQMQARGTAVPPETLAAAQRAAAAPSAPLIAATTQLVVTIASPEATKMYPFRLENIPLP